MVPHFARVEREGVEMAEQCRIWGACVDAGEVERTLYDWVSVAAVGKGPKRPVGRNGVGAR